MLAFRPRRWLVHLALAFGAGVCLGYGLPFHPLWMAGLAACLLLAALLRLRGASVYLPLMAGMALLGMLRCGMAVPDALPPEEKYVVTARVTGEAAQRESDGRVAVYLRDVRLEGAAGRFAAYWTYWPEDPEAPLPLDGQEVAFTGRVYHPMPQSNPHGFDFRLYLLQKGITLGVTGAAELRLSPENQTAPRSPLLRLRRAIREKLTELLGDHAPLAAALILNDKSDLDADVAENFRRAGVAHVLAVSGLHVMILFSCAVLALRRCSPGQRTVLAVSLVLFLAYGLLAGMQAPILRAGFLLGYGQLARVLRRRADRLTGLAAAFLGVLLIRPLDLFAAGFQMSFGAVLGLLLLGDRLQGPIRRLRSPLLRRLAFAYSAALCGAAGAVLPVIWYYHRFSLAGLLLSPAVIAAVTALLPLLLVALLLGGVWMPLGFLPARAAAFLCEAVTRGTAFGASLPLSSVLAPRPAWYGLIAFAGAAVLCSRYVLLRRGTRLLTIAALTAVCASAFVFIRDTGVQYIQFSQGNADAAVIQDGSRTLVIDTAEAGGDLASYLLSEGRYPEGVILTHLHADHALGLTQLLDQGVPIGAVYLSTEARTTPFSREVADLLDRVAAEGIPIRTLSAGDSLTLDRVRVEALWPERGGANPLGDANDFALALWIDLDGVPLLHMSDVSGAYELRAAVPASVLRVAHHGSASSTGQEFLRRVGPGTALISTRQASDAALERLAQAGAMVYDTQERGALTLSVRDGQATVRGYLR